MCTVLLMWVGVTQSRCHQIVVHQLVQAQQWFHSWWAVGSEDLSLWRFGLLLAVLGDLRTSPGACLCLEVMVFS